MSNLDLFSMALRNLFKRKLRTFLTILGVIIGSCAIIIMMSLGIGINQSFEKTINMMGDITTITVYNPSGNRGYMAQNNGSSSSSKKQLTLDDSSIASFRKLSNVVAVSPIMETDIKAVSGKYHAWLQIKGVEPSTMELFGYNAEEGNLLSANDKMSAVVGNQVAFNFYNPNDRMSFGYYDPNEERKAPVDIINDKVEVSYDSSFGFKDPFGESSEQQKKKPKPMKLKVVGKLEAANYETDSYIFMNISDVKKIKSEKQKFEKETYGGSNPRSESSKDYDTAIIKCNDMKAVESVRAEIESMGYYVDSAFNYLDEMKGMASSLQAFLGAVGAVSLFVAAIGIANTMIMAIYERTKEIGVMKVIGASIKDIKKLFLLEAALIGFIGGGFGIVLSNLISIVINKVGISFFQNMSQGGGDLSVIPLWLSLVSLVFSSAIGLISGYFPARRAMKLSALTAIKTE